VLTHAPLNLSEGYRDEHKDHFRLGTLIASLAITKTASAQLAGEVQITGGALTGNANSDFLNITYLSSGSLVVPPNCGIEQLITSV
jgi:hypothetical protein